MSVALNKINILKLWLIFFIVLVHGNAAAAETPTTIRTITGDSYWYNKLLGRILSQEDLGTAYRVTIMSHHGRVASLVDKAAVDSKVLKNKGCKTALEDLIAMVGSSTKDYAVTRLHALTGKDFASQDEWAAWFAKNKASMRWSDDADRFVTDKEIEKRSGLQLRKTGQFTVRT